MKRAPRQPSKLSGSLQRHLNAYALAASAAGVGVMALALPAQAEVVYTPANKVVPHCNRVKSPGLCLKLDLNHDGVIDFRIPWYLSSKAAQLSIRPAKYKSRNQIWGTVSYTSGRHHSQVSLASALSSGLAVGTNSAKFQSRHSQMLGFGDDCGSGSAGCKWGQWWDAQDKFLGLKFHIKGNVHYAWARFSVTNSLKVTLAGYAYETIPNKPIITGKTKGSDVIALEPGSLGALAAGASRRHNGK